MNTTNNMDNSFISIRDFMNEYKKLYGKEIDKQKIIELYLDFQIDLFCYISLADNHISFTKKNLNGIPYDFFIQTSLTIVKIEHYMQITS